jgi:type IV secretion system protein VirB2/type IV secretion system protein PtlA
MRVSTSNSHKVKILSLFAFAACFALVASPALAQGGVVKVNTFVDNLLALLRTISIGVVTIAIMVAGYKFLFKHADISEISKILGGGMLIGGAAELAVYLLS